MLAYVARLPLFHSAGLPPSSGPWYGWWGAVNGTYKKKGRGPRAFVGPHTIGASWITVTPTWAASGRYAADIAPSGTTTCESTATAEPLRGSRLCPEKCVVGHLTWSIKRRPPPARWD